MEAVITENQEKGAVTLGGVALASEDIAYLPRLCLLKDFASIPGLFAQGASKPSRYRLKQWVDQGILVMQNIGRVKYVDVHMTLKKNKIRLGVILK